MTVNTIKIVGQVLPPTGVPDTRSRVFFVMTGYDTDADDDAVIYPVPGRDDEDGFPIASDGTIDVDLWPNQEGERNTLYRVEVQVHQLNRPVRVPIASISVPNTGGPYNLNDLLGVEPPPDATVEEYIAQLAAYAAAAEDAADRAEAAAGELVGPFATRAAFVTWAGSNTADDGVIASDGTVQYVASAGATAISDLPGWLPLGEASYNHWGMVGDGVADETSRMLEVKAFSSSSGQCVHVGAGLVFLTDQIVIGPGEALLLLSERARRSTIKLNASQNSNTIHTTSETSDLYLRDIVVDQDKDNQTTGHGIRSAGARSIELRGVKVQNTVNYGIGYQAGSTLRTVVRDIEFENIGSDGFDVKDYNSLNGVIDVSGVFAKDWGVDNTTKPILDIRGPAIISNVRGVASNNCVGVRLLDSSVQGRAGSGVISNVSISGDGVNTVLPLQIETSEGNWSASNIHGESTSHVLLQSSTAKGGIVCGLTSKNTFADGVSIGGSDLKISGAYLECRDDASRCFDIEATASRVRLENFNAYNKNTSVGIAGRIVSGASDVLISGDMSMAGNTAGGTNGVDNSGTSSVLTGCRAFANV